MKKFFGLIDKKKFFISFMLAIIFSVCEYGTSFALAHYTTAPFNPLAFENLMFFNTRFLESSLTLNMQL